MPMGQLHFFTTENAARYSDMIDECGGGGADVSYTSVGWSGGVAGIDPEGFAENDMNEFMKLSSRVVIPMMETTAQDSLRGMFGCSGDIGNIPPRMATIGPRDIAHARDHVEVHFDAPCGATTSWQRLTSRLMLFGPVTPAVPASTLRLFKGICFVSDDIAADLKYKPYYNPLA